MDLQFHERLFGNSLACAIIRMLETIKKIPYRLVIHFQFFNEVRQLSRHQYLVYHNSKIGSLVLNDRPDLFVGLHPAEADH